MHSLSRHIGCTGGRDRNVALLQRKSILMKISSAAGAVLCLVMAGCASLGGLARGVQAPTFRAASGQQSEIRLVGPSLERPLGGVAVRLYAEVTNPNPVGITLAALRGNLALEGTDAAGVDFPLGLPLTAGGSSVVPLDISISFADLPRLAQLIPQALDRGAVDYRLNGTVSVDAGLLGQPTFGPMPLFAGTLATRR
jgi:hypothetical protein